MKRLCCLIVICVIAASASACMPRQAIKYSMADISTSSNSPFAQSILAVKPFEDLRKPLRTDCPRTEVSKIEKDGRTFYYNCDNHYKSDSITQEITKTITEHIVTSRLFEHVILTDGRPPDADYLLTGRVSKFDGLKEYKLSAVVASSFGLFGALVNLGNDSNYEATTELNGIQLLRLKDNTVIWSGDITGHIEGADTVDPYGWSSYGKANLSLKEAAVKLVNNLGLLPVNGIQTGNRHSLDGNHAEAQQPVVQSRQ